MKLTFYGGAKSVTGANYLLETKNSKILIDCGLIQGSNYCEYDNFAPFPYNPETIDAAVITHAHIDHTGRVPKLFKEGFHGAIYSTPPTKDFAEYMLIDSEHILRQDAERKNKEPIYSIKHVKEALERWHGVDFHKKFVVGDFTIEFYRASHILGSSVISVEAEGKRIIFTGDLGNYPSPIIGDIEYIDKADYCLIESVYGDRLHDDVEKGEKDIEDIIEETIQAGGTLMIPAFAMERTQKLLYQINRLVEHGRVPKVPVFVDSPLAIKLTNVYKKHEDYFNDKAKHVIESGDKLFNFPGLKTTLTTEESKMINEVTPPKIIMAGSGMSTGGRILHHEKRYLPDPKSTILFIGYQAIGSLGRAILEGAEEVTIMGEKIPVRCRVATLSGYSAHADQQQLLNWLIPMHQSLKKIFMVQGEPEAAESLAQRVKDELGVSAVVPDCDEVVEL